MPHLSQGNLLKQPNSSSRVREGQLASRPDGYRLEGQVSDSSHASRGIYGSRTHTHTSQGSRHSTNPLIDSSESDGSILDIGGEFGRGRGPHGNGAFGIANLIRFSGLDILRRATSVGNILVEVHLQNATFKSREFTKTAQQFQPGP
ncbi:hypothetical protein ACFE04_027915 [Oxalis oulophora]